MQPTLMHNVRCAIIIWITKDEKLAPLNRLIRIQKQLLYGCYTGEL